MPPPLGADVRVRDVLLLREVFDEWRHETFDRWPPHVTDLNILQDHLDFFEQHPKLVRELKIPTESGVAISLVEYQLRKLREQIQQLERENDHMIETARINSVLFEKTRTLVLSLLDKALSLSTRLASL